MQMQSTEVNESCFEPPSSPAFFELAHAEEYIAGSSVCIIGC